MNPWIHLLSPGESEDHRMSREKTKNSRCLSWRLTREETGLSIFPKDVHDPVIILWGLNCYLFEDLPTLLLSANMPSMLINHSSLKQSRTEQLISFFIHSFLLS